MEGLMSFEFGKMMACSIFGAIGFVAFVYGKKRSFWRPMAIGVALMAYPYFFMDAVPLYGIGIALTAALFLWRS